MTTRLLLFVAIIVPVLAQGGRGPQNREAPVTAVPFERILRANQEPQNWLTYSGNLNSQRHSPLTQISPANAGDLTLKWVFQSRSLDKHEVTPLVVDGVITTVRVPTDLIARMLPPARPTGHYPTSQAEATGIPASGN